MAWELDLFTIPSLDVDADLSAKQFFCVKLTTTNNRAELCDADGEIFFGVLQDKPDAAGKQAIIRSIGVTKVVCGETIAAGDFWGTDSAGKAKKVEHTNTGADIGDFIAGQVLEGADSGELATVTLGFPITGRVEAA